MKKTLYAIMGLALLTLVPALSEAAACNVTTQFELLQALNKPITDCADPKFQGLRSIEVTKDIAISTPLNLPDNTRLVGIVSDPYSPKVKIKGGIDNQSGYLIMMNNKSVLGSLDITNTLPDGATPAWAIIFVNGNNNIIGLNRITGAAAIGISAGLMTTYSSFNAIVGNEIAVDKGVGILLSGFKNTVIENKINLEPGSSIIGKTGILIMEWPQFVIALNALGSAPDGYGMQFAKPLIGDQIPIGMAANIMMVNKFPQQFATKDSSTPLTPTNFKEAFGKEPKDMPNCPKDANNQPYTLDGLCKQVVATKACPPSQVVLAGGDCGCVEGTALDAQLNVCVKTVEKTVDKVVEKVVEKEVIVEKPTDISKDNKIVASPAGGSGGCSLVPGQAASALTPVGVFLMTIGMTGLAAYRSSSKTPRAKGKKG